jgi:N-acyl-L-homoserine lactone synthetase
MGTLEGTILLLQLSSGVWFMGVLQFSCVDVSSKESYPSSSQEAFPATFGDNRARLSAEFLCKLRKEFVVEIADTAEAVEEAHRLRYQVYCIERGYETSISGQEIDEFDSHSRHVILRHSSTGKIVGATRLILPKIGRKENFFPLQTLCNEGILDDLPLATTAEISRFALSKQHRVMGAASVAVMRIGLMKGIVQISRESGLTHWCALMDRSLVRLLEATAIHFRSLGPLVQHRGLRQPVYGIIDAVLGRVRCREAAIWDFVTEGGRFDMRPPRTYAVASYAATAR